jgi:hypothetical protein
MDPFVRMILQRAAILGLAAGALVACCTVSAS